MPAERPEGLVPDCGVDDTTGVSPDEPAAFLNRELSLLAFHKRVYAQALDPNLPLLERFRFLCIASSNLDEFFEVRVAGLKKQIDLGSKSSGPDGMSPRAQLDAIAEQAHELQAAIHDTMIDDLMPQLNQRGVRMLRLSEWSEPIRAFLQQHFRDEILPVLSPLRLDPAHPFPKVINKCLHVLVALSGDDAFGPTRGLAVVPAPRSIPRLLRLPPELSEGAFDFVYLASILRAFASDLFPGMEIEGAWPFRVTRNSDLELHDDDDLLQAITSELPGRRFGDEVRLEVDYRVPDEWRRVLTEQFDLEDKDVYLCRGPVNMLRLAELVDMVDLAELKHPEFTPYLPASLAAGNDLFEVIRTHDVLLHHPYQSFAPVIELVRQAAADPRVLAVRQTLYRTDSGSALVEALVAAAEAGKEVTVLVELKARFDEAANIEVAARLQEAGAQVIYGVVGHKTHAKMLLIVRKEDDGIRRYVHLGTGNYHAKTARLYTDYGLLSADPALGRDMQAIFLELTGFGAVPKLEKMVQAPFRLHPFLIERIEREAQAAKDGRPAGVRARMNALIEPEIIKALYRASQAGVPIDLVVRGACSLRPGVEGLSENIRVRSIVGRLLEHSRVYTFENDGQPEVWAASADWMGRNLFRRVETCFPVEDPILRDRVLAELDTFIRDDRNAWLLRPDGRYDKAETHVGLSAQQHLMDTCESAPIFGQARRG
jgi:polyphosphate kinase